MVKIHIDVMAHSNTESLAVLNKLLDFLASQEWITDDKDTIHENFNQYTGIYHHSTILKVKS